MTMDRIEVITSVERRQWWSAAEKARLVAAMDEPDAVVTEIARSRTSARAFFIVGAGS
jgi:transposase-like protein